MPEPPMERVAKQGAPLGNDTHFTCADNAQYG